MEGSKRMSWAIRAVYQERGITDQGGGGLQAKCAKTPSHVCNQGSRMQCTIEGRGTESRVERQINVSMYHIVWYHISARLESMMARLTR